MTKVKEKIIKLEALEILLNNIDTQIEYQNQELDYYKEILNNQTNASEIQRAERNIAEINLRIKAFNDFKKLLEKII